MSKAKRPSFAGTPPSPSKQPHAAQPAQRATRVPRVADRRAEHGEHKVVWKLEVIDLDGPEGVDGWRGVTADDAPTLLKKLMTTETRRWVEIDQNRRREHYISWDSLIPAAQRRLEELKLDDARERLFSLRYGGTERLYGLRINNVFCMLWWDPKHEICPSEND